jgi:hypothetical protein
MRFGLGECVERKLLDPQLLQQGPRASDGFDRVEGSAGLRIEQMKELLRSIQVVCPAHLRL